LATPPLESPCPVTVDARLYPTLTPDLNTRPVLRTGAELKRACAAGILPAV